MKHTTIIIAVVALAITACSKDEQHTSTSYNEKVGSFKELNVPAGFDFAGVKTVTVIIEPQEGVSSDAKSLITVFDNDDNQLLKHNALLSQSTELKIEVPAGTTELFVVNASGIKETLSVSNNRLTIN